MSSNSISPNHREILSARSTITGRQEYITSTNGILNINGSFSISGSAIPISGATTAVGVAIVDSSGNQISSFGGGTQYTDGGVPPAHPIGSTIEWSDGANWQTVSTAKPLPVTATFSPSGTQDVNLTKVAGSSIALGQTTMSASLPVTIASNQASIPVAATLTAETTKVIGVTRAADGSGNLLTSTANALDINIKSGNPTTTAATQSGTWTVGSNSATGSAVPANAFYQGIVDGSGNLVGIKTAGAVSNTTGAGLQSSGPMVYDGTNFQNQKSIVNATNSTGTGIAAAGLVGQFDDTSPTSITENQFGNLRISANRNLYGTIRDAAGNERGVNVTSGNSLFTDISTANGAAISIGTGAAGTGTIRVATASDSSIASIGTSVTPGTSAAHLGKAEDAAAASGDTGVAVLGVRNDTLADKTNTDGDYSMPSTDIKGRIMTAGAPRSLKANTQTSLSNTTSETTIITATASTFHDVYGLILANTGATTTKVSIRDDTAGTVRAIVEVPTLETRGFMLPVDSAVTQTAVNKNWTAQCASATTALEVTAFYVSMV